MCPDRRREHHAREDDLVECRLAEGDVSVDDDADEAVEGDEDEGGGEGGEVVGEETVQHEGGAEEHGVVVDWGQGKKA